jgi:mono/diheme cytochrome c family protein
MAEVPGRAFAGGILEEQVAAGQVRPWSAVNLTSSKTGLASWSVNDLARYLQSGFCLRAGVFGPMNDVIENSLKRLSTDDVHAMAVYLKGLAPVETGAAAVSGPTMQRGAKIYADHCQECHMASGRGGLFSAPPLAGSAVVQAADAASLINVILYGPVAPRDVSVGGWQTMKPYRDVLNDAQIAAVSSYVRGSWKNRAGPVTSAEVARQR